MSGDSVGLSAALAQLPPKAKAPNSVRVLDVWIAQAEAKLGATRGRLGWLVASTVVAAALQQAVDEHGDPLWLLKGGTLLQHRLPGARATTDLDGLARGGIDEFTTALDVVLRRPVASCPSGGVTGRGRRWPGRRARVGAGFGGGRPARP
jgi:hypothetical protein